LQTVTSRLARRILELCERHGRAVDEGIEVDLTLSRRELGRLDRHLPGRRPPGSSSSSSGRVSSGSRGPGLVVLKPFILQSWSEM